jgi:hypothetical protein
MFASIVLPFQITVSIFAILIVVALALLVAKKITSRTLSIIATTVIVLFIPSCIGIQMVVDKFRYGKFQFESAAQMKDGYVIPPSINTDITQYRYDGHEYLQFKCEFNELIRWVESEYVKYGIGIPKNGFVEKIINLDSEIYNHNGKKFDDMFKNTNWKCPAPVTIINGPRSSRGGGYIIWYSNIDQIAYLYLNSW